MKLFLAFAVLLSWPLFSSDKISDLNTMLASGPQKRDVSPVVDDLGFARRVALDLTGQPPSESLLQEFLASKEPDKRADLIDQLLESEAYRYRWKAFYRDLFRNRKILYEYKFRNNFDDYLNQAVGNDLGWDQITHEMLTAIGDRGSKASPVAFWLFRDLEQDYRLDILDDQIGQITESFLGVRTDCISCHDGAYHLESVNKDLAKRKREEFWGMSAFLASTVSLSVPRDPNAFMDYDLIFNAEVGDMDDPRYYPGDLVPVNSSAIMDGEYHAVSGGEGMRKPRKGGLVPPRYMFGGGEPEPGETRREALARLITNDRQFARNMVNRIWAHMFGEGIVEPIDDWDLGRIDAATAASNGTVPQPKDVALMEQLTDVFIENGYKVKSLLRILANTELYQWDYQHRPSQGTEPNDYWRSTARTRRMDAESIVDSIDQVLGLDRLYYIEGRIGAYPTTWAMPDDESPDPWSAFNQPGVYFQTYEEMETYYARIYAVADALKKFGRGSLAEKTSRENISTVPASLAQLNSAYFNYYIENVTAPAINRILDHIDLGGLTPNQAALGLFRQILYREPSEGEVAAIAQLIASESNSKAFSDLCWALFNHPDFLYK